MPRVCINVTGKNSQPYRFSLDRKIVRLGRAADNDIIIDCPSVSSHHSEMRRVEGGYILQDLDSTNGIKVDGSRMEVIDLENDMEITVGDAEMEFELTDEERDTLGDEDHAPQGKPKLPPMDDAPDQEEEFTDDDESAGSDDESAGSDDESAGSDDDQDGEKPEKRRKKRPRPQAARETVPGHAGHHPGGAANFVISVVFLGLSAAAFFFGMSLKHKNKTDRSLWNDLFNKPTPTEEVQGN